MIRKKSWRLGLSLSLALLIFIGMTLLLGSRWGPSTSVAQAQSDSTIRYVAPGGDCGSVSPCYSSVQAAVDAAGDGDEIRIATGTYNENVAIDKSLTLRGGYTTTNWTTSNPVSYPTVLDASGTNRAVLSSGTDNISLTLEALEITGGGYTSYQPSGGIDIAANHIRVAIRDCFIHNNYDYWGSAGIGIAAWGGDWVLIEDSRIDNNSSDRGGTGIGIFADGGSVIIRNNTITGNSNSGYNGSGISVYAVNLVLENNVIAHNNGGSSLYVDNVLGFFSITGNRIDSNISSAYDSAGGVDLHASASGILAENIITGNQYAHTPPSPSAAGGLRLFAPAVVRNNIIQNNSRGHAVYLRNNVTFENNVVADNAPDAGFDAVRLEPYDGSDTPYTYRLVHNTVARNGNVIAIHAPAPSNATSPVNAYITDTIVYSHATGIQAMAGSMARISFSILSNTTEITGNVMMGAGILTQTDPLLLPDGYHLADDSPAKDAGTGSSFDYTDIDGQMRLMGAATDVGVDEKVYTATLALSKTRQGNGPAKAEQPITYTLAISPVEGTVWTANVRVVDIITSPYPLAGISGSGSDVACQAGKSIITCTFHHVPTDAVRAATVVVTPAIPTQSFESPDNLNITIADDNCGTYAEHTIAVNGHGILADVDVFIKNLQHTFDNDLNIYLKGPDGTQVELSTGNGGNGDNYINTIFDDEATTPITAGSAPFTGRFRPEGSLSDFDGKAPNGNWTLRVCDSTSGDMGTLNGWGLTLTLQSSPTQTLSWVITDTASMEVLDAYDPIITDNAAGPFTFTVIYDVTSGRIYLPLILSQ